MNQILSDVQVFNQALLRLGETAYPVTAVDGSDTSKFGKMAYPLYYMTRDEELRSYRWQVAKKRAQLVQAQVVTNSTWVSGNQTVTVASSVGILPGWILANVQQQGGGSLALPPGIPAGTVVSGIVDSTHITISQAPTANGSGNIYYQVNNLTGYWYAYIAPSDMLRMDSVYAVFPNFTYLWPFKIQHTIQFSYILEAGYIYTDLDPGNGNPVVEYVCADNSSILTGTANLAGTIHVTGVAGITVTQAMVGDPVVGIGIPPGTTIAAYVSSSAFDLSVAASTTLTGGTIYVVPQNVPQTPMDFAEALILRLASKMAMAVTHDLNKKKDVFTEYAGVVQRAQGNNNIERVNDEMGTPWWTDRGR